MVMGEYGGHGEENQAGDPERDGNRPAQTTMSPFCSADLARLAL